MPNALVQPASGFHSEQRIPNKVHRRVLGRPVHALRVCDDRRNYVVVPFTIPGAITVADYGPMWWANRDFWIARITANIGRHDEGTHPDDGTPSGTSVLLNMRRVTGDLSLDSAVLVADARLNIGVDHHQDAVNDSEDGAYDESDFAIKRLAEGDHIYPRISRIGSGRPGTGLVVTAVLVPIP